MLEAGHYKKEILYVSIRLLSSCLLVTWQLCSSLMNGANAFFSAERNYDSTGGSKGKVKVIRTLIRVDFSLKI
jgi:hypothetical protein